MKLMEGMRLLADELQDYAWYILLVAHLPLIENEK